MLLYLLHASWIKKGYSYEKIWRYMYRSGLLKRWTYICTFSFDQTSYSAGKEDSKKDEREELDFHFDEEVAEVPAKLNKFSEKGDDETSDYELSDGEINKILIITPHRPKKHEGWVDS